MAIERVRPGEDRAKDKDGNELDEDTEDTNPIHDDEQGEDSAEDGEDEDEAMEAAPAPKREPAARPDFHAPPEGKVSAVVPMATSGLTPVEQKDSSAKDNQMSDCILDSPQAFGIYIGNELHSFKKGKTRLTNKQKEACLSHRYVRDNGAQVYILPAARSKKD